MALRDQPYIPLYVQDVLTDEKLIECSAESQGVLFRLLCTLHKQDEYGCFLLKQKYKQSSKQAKNFASALVRPLAMSLDIIERAIEELVEEEVLFIDGDKLCQKRMIKDAEISEKRAVAGKSGGEKTASLKKNFAKEFATAKTQANTEYEIEYENAIDNENNFLEKSEKPFLKNDEFPDPDKIQESEIFKKCSKEFNQTTEVLRMRMLSVFRRIYQAGKMEEFEKQTSAYIEYKKLTNDKWHRWNNYVEDWENENWIGLLESAKSASNQTKPGMNAKGKTTKDFLNV